MILFLSAINSKLKSNIFYLYSGYTQPLTNVHSFCVSLKHIMNIENDRRSYLLHLEKNTSSNHYKRKKYRNSPELSKDKQRWPGLERQKKALWYEMPDINCIVTKVTARSCLFRLD